MTETVIDSTLQPAPTSTSAAQVLAVRHSRAMTTSTELTAASDTVIVGKLPKGHVVVDCIVDVDDLDSGGSPAVVFDVGVEDDTDAFIAASTAAQAGGIARMNNKAGPRLAASDSDREVILTITTPPATDQSGTIGCTLFYKAKPKE
ncbi:MAG TPA: hypothetical protein VGE69_17220 [Pseudomonadales bacterium]